MDTTGKGTEMGTCYMVLRNRKTGKLRRCGRPALANGVCEKHQSVLGRIEHLNTGALASLNEPEVEEEAR